jgi:threonine-phosphate decarboxylase
MHRYPDSDTKRLRKRLGQYHGIDPETILCGNGSTELIHLIAKAFQPQKVLMLSPTFSEYERACGIHGETEVIHYGLSTENNFDLNPDTFIEAIKGKSPGMAFLCNPNNPTGRLLEKQAMKKIANAAKEYGCLLIVDEAYIDFSPGDSMVEEVSANPYLFVLKSMSHYYALAGIRLGYGIFPLHCIERLNGVKEPWMVNSLAQKSAAAALKDIAYRKESTALMHSEKAFLEKNLRKLGIHFFPSEVNFYLVKTALAPEIYQRLRSKGILVRECSDFQGLGTSYLRIAVKSHRENAVLIRELTKIMPKRG